MKLINGFVFAALCLVGGSAFGASTLQISNAFSGKIAAGFAAFGSATGTDGMQWGIIVDTGGDGFDGSGTAYNNMLAGSTTNAFMNVGGVATDDYFVSSGAVTADSSAAFESGFTVSGGKGTIGNIAVTYSNGIAAGQSFGLIWFNSNSAAVGDRYGFLNLGQVMPADNLPAVDMSAPYAGVDPIRQATNTFTSGAGPVPEPSRMMLLAFGLVGLFFRRRR